jgi:hypothetical protein
MIFMRFRGPWALNGSRELDRVEVMGRVGSGNLKLRDAAVMLDLSYRQTKRCPLLPTWRPCSSAISTVGGCRIGVPVSHSGQPFRSIKCRHAMQQHLHFRYNNSATPSRRYSAISQPHATATVGGTLMEVRDGKEIEHSVVIIRGERIAEVGIEDKLRSLRDAPVVAGHGKWLLPQPQSWLRVKTKAHQITADGLAQATGEPSLRAGMWE